MKKLIALSMLVFVAAFSAPAFADGAAGNKGVVSTGSHDGFATSSAQMDNVHRGVGNATSGLQNYMDATHEEASKGRNTGEHLTGVVAGGAIGVRRTIHRAGAGAIDLLTFWIPKKEPLIKE